MQYNCKKSESRGCYDWHAPTTYWYETQMLDQVKLERLMGVFIMVYKLLNLLFELSHKIHHFSTPINYLVFTM